MNRNSHSSETEPQLYRSSDESLSLEDRRAIAAVNEPVLTARLIHRNQLLVTIAGTPRAGTTREFMRLLDELLTKEKPADITLEEVSVVSRIDHASSTYLFSHTASDLVALQDFADNLLKKFEKRAFSLPVPCNGNEYEMVVHIERDASGQLYQLLARLEELAEQEPGAVNLIALDGRRYYQERPGAPWFSLLRFVISLPENLVQIGDASSLERLAAEIRTVGKNRGEEWKVEIRPYTGHFMDELAGRYGLELTSAPETELPLKLEKSRP
jgi:hypothetical protein